MDQQNSGGSAKPTPIESAGLTSSPVAGDFPSEPFNCPSCGQLLGATTRVCPVCKSAINPAEIGRSPAPVFAVPSSVPRTQPPRERVAYPWGLLLLVLAIGMFLGLISMLLLGQDRGREIIQGIPIVAGMWVFFDAYSRRLPRPFRWSLGTMLLLAVVFPWYLARRNKPAATVPFIEAETTPVTRVLFIILAVLFLIALAIGAWQGQQNSSKPGSSPAGKSGTQLTRLRPDSSSRA